MCFWGPRSYRNSGDFVGGQHQRDPGLCDSVPCLAGPSRVQARMTCLCLFLCPWTSPGSGPIRGDSGGFQKLSKAKEVWKNDMEVQHIERVSMHKYIMYM